jgi:cephalosporin hydroxylase
MITTIDEERGEVVVQNGAEEHRYPLTSPQAFAAASRAWLRAGWDTKYIYSFTWFGRPIIQLPDDLVRMQEVVYRLKPDVIVETGVAHGGSLIFYASLLQAIGHGRVVGIDLEIRPHNRTAIEAHPLFHRITLIEGDSISPATAKLAAAEASNAKIVLVVLDSNHSKTHVLSELHLYSPLVSVGSYIVACDGIMELVAGGPRTKPDWPWNNPRQAALDFVKENSDFQIEEPAFPFNEGVVNSRVTYWPDAFVRRVR